MRCNACPNCAVVEKCKRQMLAICRPTGRGHDDGTVAVWNDTLRDYPCFVYGAPELVYVAAPGCLADGYAVRSTKHYGILAQGFKTEAEAIEYAWTYADDHTQAQWEDYLRGHAKTAR